LLRAQTANYVSVKSRCTQSADSAPGSTSTRWDWWSVVMDGHVRVEPTGLDCIDRPQRRFAWLKKKIEEVDHSIRQSAGSRCRIRAGSAVTVIDTTAVTVEDRHPCCRSNRTCPLPLPATAPSPPVVLRITIRSTRSVSWCQAPSCTTRDSPPLMRSPRVLHCLVWSLILSHSIPGVTVCLCAGGLIANGSGCRVWFEILFFVHPVNCCSAVYRLCRLVQRA